MLPVSLAIELDCIAKTLADAFLNRVTIQWDATRYAMRLPKKPSAPGTRTANAAEESIRRQYPPMSDSAAAEAAESGPQIVIDTDNIILAWYLPGLQNAIMAATEKLRSFLGKKQTGASSRTRCENFHPGTDVKTGMITLSPAWFQQGHNASVNFKLPAAMSWLEEISESNAILSAILGVIHPHLYKSGQDTFSRLRRAAEIDRQDVLRDWTSVFSGVSVIFNGNPPSQTNFRLPPPYQRKSKVPAAAPPTTAIAPAAGAMARRGGQFNHSSNSERLDDEEDSVDNGSDGGGGGSDNDGDGDDTTDNGGDTTDNDGDTTVTTVTTRQTTVVTQRWRGRHGAMSTQRAW
ncbi:hypothetical protein EDB85DRAFT_2157127 [Lactarius pseudohatsudake]|nr:hypothetical protein EDB85DRAFT_2157127 [Lactarius pseudohatsudake]